MAYRKCICVLGASVNSDITNVTAFLNHTFGDQKQPNQPTPHVWPIVIKLKHSAAMSEDTLDSCVTVTSDSTTSESDFKRKCFKNVWPKRANQ